MSVGQGTSATLNELRDPERRPSRLSEAIPFEISRFWPQHQFQLDREKYASNFRAASRDSAGGLAGDTNEHLKMLLDDEEATLLVTEAAEHLCVADVPGEIADALCMHEHHMCVLGSLKNWRDLHREPSACGTPRTQPRCWPVKAWRCQSGPDSQSPISARRNQSIQRWESGLTVGHFTHQLLATPFLQLACTCHRCPQTTKLCRHRNEVLVLRATSAVCPLVTRPHFRLRSSARCS